MGTTISENETVNTSEKWDQSSPEERVTILRKLFNVATLAKVPFQVLYKTVKKLASH